MKLYDALSYGVAGLGFLLALLSYRLLAREQNQHAVRPRLLKAIYYFMAFSIALCLIGLIAQLFQPKSQPQIANDAGHLDPRPPISTNIPILTSTHDTQTNAFFAVISSTPDKVEARRAADNLVTMGFHATVYPSSSGAFAVAVPAPSKEEAQKVLSQLIRKGLAKPDSYISSGAGFRAELTR